MASQPKREVSANLLTSSAQPAIKVRIADGFSLLGSLQFVLYEVADVELFVFVSADAEKRVSSLFLAQFERYLETNAHTYNYPPTHLVTLNGYEYVHDTFAYPSEAAFRNPKSNSARTMSLVVQRGYTLPTDIISARFVRLLDNRRKEILFSYAEDLSHFGHAAAEISHDFRLLPAYSSLEDQLLQHALDVFEVIKG